MVSLSASRLAFDRRSRAAGLALATAAPLTAAFILSPAHIEDGPIICPFRRLTGLPCPGCGLTRSWVYIAHGDFSRAWAANPFGLLTFLAAFVVLAVAMVCWARDRPLPSPRESRTAWRAILVVSGVWVVFGIIRAIVSI